MFRPVAIVGMSCNLPGARNYREYWRNLRESAVLYAATDRPSSSDFRLRPEKGLINEAEMFDPSRYNLSEKEAELMDPQVRKFIELVDDALEDAHYSRGEGLGKVGVVASQGTNHTYHHELTQYQAKGLLPDADQLLININRGADFLATRVSYLFNFNGPSFNLQSACSSSMASVVESLYLLHCGRCDAVITGGINISYPLEQGYLYEQGSIYSKTGMCRPFDTAADGTIPSNGGGVLVLKLLDRAEKDGDHIHAVIRAAGSNNDGNQKVSYAAPSVRGQYELLSDIYRKNNIDPWSLKFIECHATGTVVGDPIEIRGIKMLLDDYPVPETDDILLLGSVKGNVGHLFWSSGVASIIKSVMSIQYGEYPPTANFSQHNPMIEIDNRKLAVNSDIAKLPDEGPVLCGVSSFGVGGTNSHIVLQRYRDRYIRQDDHLSTVPMASDTTNKKNYSIFKKAIPISSQSEFHGQGALQNVPAFTHVRTEEVVKLYEIALGESGLDVDSDYFEYYGDSISAVTLMSDIAEKYGIAITAEDIYQNPTPGKLAEYLKNNPCTTASGNRTVTDASTEPRKFNAYQSRFYLLEKTQRGEYSHYNVPICMEIDSQFPRDQFNSRINAVLKAIDLFSMQLKWQNGIVLTEQERPLLCKVRDIQLNSEQDMHIRCQEIFGERFDLEKGPVCMITYLSAPGRHLLIINMPHLLIDGKGIDNLFCAVQGFTDRRPVEEKYMPGRKTRYYCEADIEFWKEYLEDLPTTKIFCDTQSTKDKGNHGVLEERIQVSSSLLDKIRQACSRSGSTPYALVYSAFNYYLSMSTLSNKVCTGTTVINREENCFESLGCYINNIPVVVDFTGTHDFEGALETTMRSLQVSMKHSNVPLDVIVSEIASSGHSIYNVIFMFQNQTREYSLTINGRKYFESDIQYQPLYADICVNIIPDGDGAVMSVTFNAELYTSAFVRQYFSEFLSFTSNCIETMECVTNA